mmetsp:Transcript_13623/g.33485  ORF Transcript_13623/g.33485 Transcript_13623/m.33485 type:complete len:447 (-) Transcript_13623:93-1433(-)
MHLQRAITEAKKEDERKVTEQHVAQFFRNSLAGYAASEEGSVHGLRTPLRGNSPAAPGTPMMPPPNDPLLGLHGPARDLAALSSILLSSWVNLLLVCVPLGLTSALRGWGPVPTFFLNFGALIPLALILGDITEDLALRYGPAVGGLINATFGNVVEILLSLAALRMGLYDVVAYSLLGSILSNLLLVLGCCMLLGGLRFRTQSFNEIGNRACSSLLFLAVIGIIMPTAAKSLVTDVEGGEKDAMVMGVSRFCAVLLLIAYGCYLVFQLKTHTDLFEEAKGDEEAGEEEEEEVPNMTTAGAMCAMGVISVIVAVASYYITGCIEGVAEQLNLSHAFLAMIVLPIAGNACEHITAIIVAMKNKMDLALGVAVGSSIQIALLALPLCVVVGWATGHPFGLDLDAFSALALTAAVIHSNVITSDATSHWLLGVQLIGVYVILAITYFYR